MVCILFYHLLLLHRQYIKMIKEIQERLRCSCCNAKEKRGIFNENPHVQRGFWGLFLSSGQK